MTQKRWASIVNNDKKADDDFIYAVKTTQIFCKPSCKARLPKKENVVIYENAQGALADGYRPCKKCNPLESLNHSEEWSLQIKNIVQKYYKDNLSLSEITSLCHGSKFHLSRLFKQENGMSIMEYQYQVKMEKALELIYNEQLAIKQVAEQVGYKSTSHFIKHFKVYYGQTPKKFINSERLIVQKSQ
ncbi:bifunctional transcriptional activator/DNA repair enzyme AdaA [Staphylococcus caeli]|uniref:bifunctional transcriptional activator/DNA repair enzyme AdaA n=1 Tax=Staphylococcus caeli TaxID=2201815 RepID=UPI003F568347